MDDDQYPSLEVIEILDDDEGKEGNDSEISIVDPPPKAPQTTTSTRRKNNDEDEDDELEIVSSNITNPNIQFPHKRIDCGVYSWSKCPQSFCSKCYCVVCDIPSNDCQNWVEHCMKDGNEPRRHINKRERPDQRRQRHDLDDNEDGNDDEVDNDLDDDDDDDADDRTVGDDVLLESPTDTARNVAYASAIAAARIAINQQTAARVLANTRNQNSMEILRGGRDQPLIQRYFTNSSTNCQSGEGIGGISPSSTSNGRSSGVSSYTTRHHHHNHGQQGKANGDMIPTNGEDDGSGRDPTNNNKSLRIVDVLGQKLKCALQFSDGSREQHHGNNNKNNNKNTETANSNTTIQPSKSGVELYKMMGDIPQLGLHSTFFVEAVKIGWPFPVILTPQRLMAIHIIKALKRRLHVVLESPTGTGKSAAILCSVLAWQRYHMQTNQGLEDDDDDDDDDNGNGDYYGQFNEDELLADVVRTKTGLPPRPSTTRKVPQIIYCSRTHSQVAQMVSSLRKTPYRPRMTVLGSRERMCIHKGIIGGSQQNTRSSSTTKVPINQACRVRKTNTEKERRRLLKDRSNEHYYYDDDNPQPPPARDGTYQDEWRGDSVPGGEGDNDDTANHAGEGIASNGGENSRPRKAAPTCPHFRQLSSRRTATMVADRFVGDPTRTRCCSSGGEETNFGVHDLEDLIRFGKNPYYDSNIAIYRPEGTDKFGFVVTPRTNGMSKELQKGCKVHEIILGGAAAIEARLKVGDWIVKVNGRDVRFSSMDKVLAALQATSKNEPLRLGVLHADSDTSELLEDGQLLGSSITAQSQTPRQDVADNGDNDDYEIPYSEHAPCPYYLSRAIHPHTDLTFAPYNYILDPAIRRAMNISLKNKVIVLDEAHNVESTLCESGSGKYSEIDLCQLVSTLAPFARRNEKTGNISLVGSTEKVDTHEVAHDLLMFVENMVVHLQKLRQNFENSPARNKLGSDYQRFHNIPDNHEVELSYDGPTGYGLLGRPVGCKPFLERLGLTKENCSELLHLALSMEQSMFGGDQGGATSSDQQDASSSNALTILVEILSKLCTAAEHPEHFYISCIVQANGSLDHALGIGAENSTRRWKKNPRRLPFISPRTVRHPHLFLPVCDHTLCSQGPTLQLANLSGVRHGEYCNGSMPPWEAHLVLKLLSPGLLLKDIAGQCRSLILASGSLAPLPSLCAELDLFGREGSSNGSETPPNSQSQSFSLSASLSDSTTIKELGFVGRLQTLPKPLEANHVIDLPKQLFAVTIGHFPDGQPLTVTYSNFKQLSFYPKLGSAIACVVESIPRGGVLVFFPSYSFLDKCVSCWNPTNHYERYPRQGGEELPSYDVWQRLLRSKGKVIVESTSSQEAFEAARDEYRQTVKASGSCILLAVFRGKMSEGISFNDDNARGVICVGMPYPNARERSITAKKAYNDEQRKLRRKTCLLPGQEWYTQQASRAVAQALGRCIRHGADFGTVVLMDSRHCDDGSPNDGICIAHKNLPKWMRNCVRTLSMHSNAGFGVNPILGGYVGLKKEMATFFAQAPSISQAVRIKWKKDLEKAKAGSSDSSERVFDNVTARWNSCKSSGPIARDRG